MVKGGELDTNIWIDVNCCNALQLKKRNPKLRVSCSSIKFLKKAMKRMKTFIFNTRNWDEVVLFQELNQVVLHQNYNAVPLIK